MNIEEIYLSMLGELITPLPGVKNAFAPGQRCALLYEQLYAAKSRLCQRLDTEEDADVECILDCFWEITRELSMQMYRMGTDRR